MAFHESVVLVFLVLPLFHFSCVSTDSITSDTYLIDCGSSSNVSIGNRWFQADDSESQNILKTPKTLLVSTNKSSSLSSFDAQLYTTARIFNETSLYTFRIRKPGRFWIRLYFFPFVDQNHNLSSFRFSVSAQNHTLLRDFHIEEGSTVKEFSLNISSETLVLAFAPSSGSSAFVNALEVVPMPRGLIPEIVESVGSRERARNVMRQALETVARVNMGNESVSPENDTLARAWIPDGPFLITPKTSFVSRIGDVRYRDGLAEDVAPKSVYGTATALDVGRDVIYANLSWQFSVSPGFEYLVRFHFCDIVDPPVVKRSFNAYVNSWLASSYDDLTNQSSDTFGVPYFLDVVARVSDSASLKISVGPRSVDDIHAIAFLNGLEIMKLGDSEDSSEATDSFPARNSKRKIVLMACLAAGLFVIVASVAALSLFLCRRRRRKLSLVAHSKAEAVTMNVASGIAAFSGAEIAYSIPLWVIREATDNFSENLVIGVGGFGKVYKGVLRDNRAVAIKRGFSQSNQGLSEFRTEIEMLSQFRHRHLVSLIGYCDERGEMIIVYEYMENGTLKERLYGSGFPSLSWRQRLHICIGSARGLHYLHTGTAKAIIHRDVKSANILIDENFMAKVADFGLSKTGPEIDKTHVSTAVKGSFGYLDPEYLIMQQLTEKSDVYSFGVVMLEVLCGRAVIDPSLQRDRVNLIDWAMKYQKTGQLEEIADPCLAGQVNPESLLKFGEIVEKCLAEHGVMRPTMGDVLWNLECALQLQGSNGEASSQANNGDAQLENSLSKTEISAASFGDLNGVSMSKVFAQMVKEEMR